MNLFLKPTIRTEYLISNSFAYLLKDCYKFEPLKAFNKEEEKILNKFIIIIDEFEKQFKDKIIQLCMDMMNIEEADYENCLKCVYENLFDNDITLSKIIAYIIYVNTFIMYCTKKSDYIVNMLYSLVLNLYKPIDSWVNSHNGWNNVLEETNLPCNRFIKYGNLILTIFENILNFVINLL